jgi:hypothetical protein
VELPLRNGVVATGSGTRCGPVKCRGARCRAQSVQRWGSVKRLLVALLVGSLVATAVAVAPASAADTVKGRLYLSGAILAAGEVRGDVFIYTELAASERAERPNAAPSPLLYLNQGAYTYNADTGDIGDFVWSASTQVTDFQLNIARDLSSATASTTNAEVERCDATWTCTSATASLSATFHGIGPILRFHQNAVSSVSGQSRFVYHSSGPTRFASATVTVGPETFGPFTGPVDASIFDTRTGNLEATLVPFGTTAPAPAGGVGTHDTTAPGVGQQAGAAVHAGWVSTRDGITIETFVSGSTRRVNSNGTFTDEKLAVYNEQVYATDDQGTFTPLSSTFTVEGATADSVVVDNVLRSGAMRAAALRAVTCTWPDGEIVCVDTTVSVDLLFVGFGDTTRTLDGGSAGVAGFWTETYHRTASTRQATVTGTIDGQDQGTSGIGQLDQFRQGYRKVEIKPIH